MNIPLYILAHETVILNFMVILDVLGPFRSILLGISDFCKRFNFSEMFSLINGAKYLILKVIFKYTVLEVERTND